MEFWGVEVKAGKPLKVKPDEDSLIHLSQACIDNGRKGETAVLYVTLDGKKLVLGSLSERNIPQISFDLVFEMEFELSHSLERGSVHFIGYKTPNLDEEENYYSSSDSEEEEEEEEEELEVPATVTAGSEPKAKPEEVKHESDEDDEGSEEKGVSVCTCFPGGWMLTRMIQMMSEMTLGMKNKK